MEVEDTLPDMDAHKMRKEGFYLVKTVGQSYAISTAKEGTSQLWEGFSVDEATWVPFSPFALPHWRLILVLEAYFSKNSLGDLLMQG